MTIRHWTFQISGMFVMGLPATCLPKFIHGSDESKQHLPVYQECKNAHFHQYYLLYCLTRHCGRSYISDPYSYSSVIYNVPPADLAYSIIVTWSILTHKCSVRNWTCLCSCVITLIPSVLTLWTLSIEHLPTEDGHIWDIWSYYTIGIYCGHVGHE